MVWDTDLVLELPIYKYPKGVFMRNGGLILTEAACRW